MVVRALARETIIEHNYLIGSAPPFPNQPGSGFQLEPSTPPDLSSLIELLDNLVELALVLWAEPSKSDFLHPVCDGAQ